MAQTVRLRKTRVTKTRTRKNGKTRRTLVRKPRKIKRKVTVRYR